MTGNFLLSSKALSSSTIYRFVGLTAMSVYGLQGEADISILVPHCMSRASALHREVTVKVRLNNTWTYLNTEDTTVDEYKVSYSSSVQIYFY